MAYDKKKIHKQALEAADKEGCLFIEQVVSLIPISKPTFYEYYPAGSDEFNAIKEICDNNKVARKSAMYNKWFDSDNATLQVSLMKLIASDKEAQRLNGSKQEVKNVNINTEEVSIEDVKDISAKLDEQF